MKITVIFDPADETIDDVIEQLRQFRNSSTPAVTQAVEPEMKPEPQVPEEPEEEVQFSDLMKVVTSVVQRDDLEEDFIGKTMKSLGIEGVTVIQLGDKDRMEDRKKLYRALQEVVK